MLKFVSRDHVYKATLTIKFKIITNCDSVTASPSIYSPHGLLSTVCYKIA